MIAKLEFTLPDEEESLRDTLNAGRMRGALWEIGQYLRKRDKYGDMADDARREIQQARTAFYAAVEGLELDL